MNRRILSKFKVAQVIGLSLMIGATGVTSSYANAPYKLPVKEGYFNAKVAHHSWNYANAKQQLNDWLGFAKQVEWKEIEHTKEVDGKFRVALVPEVAGLEMSGNMVVMHFRNGILYSMNGNVGQLKNNLSTIPQVSSQVAIEKASQQYGIVYSLNDAKADLAIRNIEGQNQLVWKVAISGLSPKTAQYSSMYVYVDAHNGEVLHGASRITNHNTQGSGLSSYYGDVDLDILKNEDNVHFLKDTIRNIDVTNAGGLTMPLSGTSIDIDDVFPGRRPIINDTSHYGIISAIQEVTIGNLPDSLVSGYGFSGMSITLPVMVVIEIDENDNTDTVGRVIFGMDPSLTFPETTKEIYVPIYEGKTYEIGFQKVGVNFLNFEFQTISEIITPILDVSVGFHELDPNPEVNFAYNIEKSPNLGVDGLYAIQTAYDFYKDKFDRDGVDDQNTMVHVVVDGIYSAGFSQMNAMALPESYMVAFGVGDGVYMGPLSSLDVLVHEYQHIVTDHNGRGGLEYSKESGALNEAWSDIFAKAVEYEALPNSFSWQIGKDISLIADGFMRDMENPKAANSLGMIMPKQPNTYKGTYWIDTESQEDNGGVHYNSGVANKWFYLLVEGGYGTNDYNDEYEMEGIGLDKAIQIAYAALMERFTPVTTYPQAAELTLEVAEELYGEASEEYQAVYDAWYAVGLFSHDVSINEQDAIAGLYRMYPNPAKDQVYVENKSTEQMTIEIWNVTGQRIHSQSITTGQHGIDVEHLSSGVYFVNFYQNGQKKTEKLVIR